MKTTPITHADLHRSVIAVPPLARNADLSLNVAANSALLRHLETAGVRSVMYGGNANLYHIGVREYARLMEVLANAGGPDTWILPAAGPDYGKLMDQAAILRSHPFPTAMLLPMSFPYTDAGLADGIRRFSDALGKPVVVYIKSVDYIAPATLARLGGEGRIAAVKYAVVCDDASADAYLAALVAELGPDGIVSGSGERPALVHFRQFGLRSFTSGSVCVAPRSAMALLHHLHAGDFDRAAEVRARFMALEDCRDAISPIRVLHDAVTLAGVADMGPMLPLLSGLTQHEREAVAPVARALYEADRGLA